MARAWDRYDAKSLSALQDRLVRAQVRDAVAPFSPLWRRRFDDLGRNPASIRTVADLARIPAVGERDVSPSGDPAGMAAMVIQAGEAGGVTLHGPGPQPRRTLRLRLTRPAAYRRLVDADTRTTWYVFTGLGFRYPIGSTRADLDVIARAGARLWSVLGLTSDDVLLSAVPPAATTEHVALQYAALAAGAPALFPGSDPAAVGEAARVAPPTVVAVPSATAPQALSGASGLASVRTLLLVGAPSDAERVAAAHALFQAGGPSDATILAVHAPVGARVLWGECRASGGAAGLHTYPDLDVVQTVSPDTAEPSAAGGELVLTQLGLRGSALLRWRTGDVVSAVAAGACHSCGRTVPRLEGLRRAALRAELEPGRRLDLRSVAGVMAARPDIRDWRLVVGRRGRDGAVSVVVHFAALDGDDPQTVIAVASEIRARTGVLPTQLVATDRAELAELPGTALSAHILLG